MVLYCSPWGEGPGTKEVYMSSDNKVSQLHSPVQYDTDAVFWELADDISPRFFLR